MQLLHKHDLSQNLPICNSHPCRSLPDKVLRSLKGQQPPHFLLLRHQMLLQQLVSCAGWEACTAAHFQLASGVHLACLVMHPVGLMGRHPAFPIPALSAVAAAAFAAPGMPTAGMANASVRSVSAAAPCSGVVMFVVYSSCSQSDWLCTNES